MKNCVFAIIFGLLCAACASVTALISGAEDIYEVYEKPQNCEYLYRVEGEKIDRRGSLSLAQMRESAINDLKNKVAGSELGGNTVHIVSNEKRDKDKKPRSEYLVVGDVYKCNLAE